MKEDHICLLRFVTILTACYFCLIFASLSATRKYYPYYVSLALNVQKSPILNYKMALLFITSPFNPLEVYARSTNAFNFALLPVILFICVALVIIIYDHTRSKALRSQSAFNCKNSAIFLLLSFPASYLVSLTIWFTVGIPANGSSIITEYLLLALAYVICSWLKDLYLFKKKAAINAKLNASMFSCFLIFGFLLVVFGVSLQHITHVYGFLYSLLVIVFFHFWKASK